MSHNFFWKNCENYIQKWILQVIFQRSCLDCPKNKIDNNFFITSPNRMNQRFTGTQKCIIFGKNSKKLFWLFVIFLGYSLTSIFGLLSYNFCSWALIEIKIIFPQSLCNLLASHKVLENYDEYWDFTSLPEVVFWPP